MSPFPNDMSPAGLRAMASHSPLAEDFTWRLPEATLAEIQRFIGETRAMGLERRSERIAGASGPLNVRANNAPGDRVGETQGEVAVAVYRDTVVIGWNDSQGFLAGSTVSSYAYSTNGGASFVDGGNMPLAAVGDQAFGDPGIDTDERGSWYYNQIYTRAGPQQNIGVHFGRFNGAGVLAWNPPTQAAIGTAATGNLDKCLLACDRVTGNVYTAYTRFTAVPQIEIVRSTTLGATWNAPIILDATAVPTASKQGVRPFCGPGGEVYAVWEKGANTINCPDGGGTVLNTTGQMAFTRSLDFGVSYSPLSVIGTVNHSWTWSGPGDLRERGNEFPDIAVDRSGGAKNGRIYVTWHESGPWTSSQSAGVVTSEGVAGGAVDIANNNPGGATLFSIGDDVTGTTDNLGDLDYWRFTAAQGQSFLFNLDPSGFICGVANAGNGMRMRIFATQAPYPNPTGFPDTLLAASALGGFAQRIVWTAPRTGDFLVRLQRSGGVASFTYTLRVRALNFSASPARDARDVVVVRSADRGLTWSGEQMINDDAFGLENRRPFISVDGLGHVHAYWHDSRLPGLGTNAALTTIYGTTSRDGGVTWSPNYCVTDELSFFSFNTIAVPNLGDYNQAASYGANTHPAWTDQRLSTGDVRTPNTNTYSAGAGPEAFTTRTFFAMSRVCAVDTTVGGNYALTRVFRITNTGNLPDRYNYTVTDGAGWIGGPIAGNTGELAPGGTYTLKVSATTAANCSPTTDTITLAVTPSGDQDGLTSCSTVVTCNPALDVDPPNETFTFALGRIAPNPATRLAQIDYSVATRAQVRLSILDVLGREVAVLAQGVREPGVHRATWNGRSAGGEAPVGIYFARYQAAGRLYSKRFVLAH